MSRSMGKVGSGSRTVICSGAIVIFIVAMSVTLGLYYSGRPVVGLFVGGIIVMIGAVSIVLLLNKCVRHEISGQDRRPRETDRHAEGTHNEDQPSPPYSVSYSVSHVQSPNGEGRVALYIPEPPPYTPSPGPDNLKPPSYEESISRLSP